MRLWSKDLISVLPRQQLLSQWRECCCIAKSISDNGTPNHILVNKILDYPLAHFVSYTMLVYNEMVNRGYKVDRNKFYERLPKYEPCNVSYDELYSHWHNKRYLKQCIFNLQEKADCGGVTLNEWSKIKDLVDKKGIEL